MLASEASITLRAASRVMAIFMDIHEGAALGADIERHIRQSVKSGTPDAHGVIDRAIIVDKQANKAYCILEAADADAIRKHHESLGVPLDESSIHPVDAILK